MSKRDPLVRVRHMRDHAQKAVQMAAGRTRAELDRNEMLRFAPIHLVELVGEAASHVPKEVRSDYPHIPWADIIAMRHRLIHGYDTVDCEILWQAITEDLPPPIAGLEMLLASETP